MAKAAVKKPKKPTKKTTTKKRSSKISKLKGVHEVLTSLGYEAVLKDESVVVKVGGFDKPFVAVITHNKPTKHFKITCMVATIKEIGEEKLAHLALAALDANIRIAPFAYALLTEAADPKNDDEMEWPIVLTHSLPIGDLSKKELESAMHSLLGALLDGNNVITAIDAK